MPKIDQSSLATTVNQSLVQYRKICSCLGRLKAEIASLADQGQAVPKHLSARVERTENLLARLKRELIRLQNDHLRVHLAGGRLMITSGVQGQGEAFVRETIAAMRQFDSFTSDNDPYGEHDFGAITVADTKLFFKIDAYDRDLCHGSPDPADPMLTVLVMTVMLAEEY